MTEEIDNSPQNPEDLLGDRIRQVRERMGLTHDGISNLTKLADVGGKGISRTTIRGYELGIYKPGAREIRILCESLEVSANWLLLGIYDDENKPKSNTNETIDGRHPTDPKSPRWANLAFNLLAFLRLETDERQQLVKLARTLFKLKIGEVEYRKQKRVIEDLIDIIQDNIRDTREGTLDQKTAISIALASIQQIEDKHGKPEADMLRVLLLDLIPATLSAIAEDEKSRA